MPIIHIKLYSRFNANEIYFVQFQFFLCIIKYKVQMDYMHML